MASIYITSPSEGLQLDVGCNSCELVVAIAGPGSRNWNWRLDVPFPIAGKAGGNEVTSENLEVSVTDLTPGRHILYVALVDSGGFLGPVPQIAQASFVPLPWKVQF